MLALEFRSLLALGLLLLTGCTGGGLNVPTGTVSGTVTIDGKPLSDATITFIGETNGDTASGALQSDGTYSLKYGSGFSVPAGDYRVVVVAGAAGGSGPANPEDLMKTVKVPQILKSPIPDKYKDPKTSALVAVVKEGTNPNINFDLKK